MTYSGHKGKGYEVQVAETCHEENATQLITHVEVTPSSGSDTDVSVPVVDGLAERKVRPDELFADTAYGSGRNAFEASRRGTELVSPMAGSAPGNSHEGEGDGPPPLTAADFQIDVTGEQATVCPAGHPSIEEYELKDAPERVEVHFAGTTCEPWRSRCPVKQSNSNHWLRRTRCKRWSSGNTAHLVFTEERRPVAFELPQTSAHLRPSS